MRQRTEPFVVEPPCYCSAGLSKLKTRLESAVRGGRARELPRYFVQTTCVLYNKAPALPCVVLNPRLEKSNMVSCASPGWTDPPGLT